MSTPPGVEDAGANPAYAAQIAYLVATHITSGYRGLSHLPLLLALGCQSPPIGWNGVQSTTSTILPTASDEALVGDVLRQLLRRIVQSALPYGTDNFSLLNGLHQNMRWLDCLHTDEDAYCLAALCLWHASDRYDKSPKSRLVRGAIELWLTELLNAWLMPDSPYSKLPNIAEVGSALFGEAWYDFNVAQMGLLSGEVPGFIYNARPPFRPGLLLTMPDTDISPLPALEGP
jgi:hypothetical protein